MLGLITIRNPQFLIWTDKPPLLPHKSALHFTAPIIMYQPCKNHIYLIYSRLDKWNVARYAKGSKNPLTTFWTSVYIIASGIEQLAKELRSWYEIEYSKWGTATHWTCFRPESNLQFIFKLNEKASDNQFSDHIHEVRSLPSSQSAYRAFHSTETAFPKVQCDNLLKMVDQKANLLVMLDLKLSIIHNWP